MPAINLYDTVIRDGVPVSPTPPYLNAPWQVGGNPMPDRELLEAKGNKRYVRRDANGRFTSSQADVGASLTQDRRKAAKPTVPAGQGDKGDQKKR